MGPLPSCPQPGLLVVPRRRSGAAGQRVQHLVPMGPLHLAMDETPERHWGAKIEALGVYWDPVRLSPRPLRQGQGAALGQPDAVGQGVLGPPGVGPALSDRAGAVPALPRSPGLLPQDVITDWARQMLCRLRRWLPDRELVVVGDWTYATLKLLAACQAMTSPITFSLQFMPSNGFVLLLRHVELSPVGQVRSHECLEELAVVWHPAVKQLVDDYEVLELRFAFGKVGGQCDGA